jgi:NAD(P)-dependent dehydrogenase (short-subunit alcohol dehydrogenase family)
MDLGFQDKVALVTGTGSQIGFGRSIAIYLAKEGCDVVGADINIEGAEKVAAEIKALGRKSIAVKADISSISEVEAMVKKALAEFGKIDILVNNAGTSNVLKPFLEITKEEFDKLINVNLWGTMNVTRAVVPHMLSRSYGRIVNISGGQGYPAISLYGASKGGVDSFTKSTALELVQYGIIVNGVIPALGNTGLNAAGRGGRVLNADEEQKASKMFGLKRFCTGDDVGPLVAFLASDVCSYMVGQIIHMSAGAPPMRLP